MTVILMLCRLYCSDQHVVNRVGSKQRCRHDMTVISTHNDSLTTGSVWLYTLQTGFAISTDSQCHSAAVHDAGDLRKE